MACPPPFLRLAIRGLRQWRLVSRVRHRQVQHACHGRYTTFVCPSSAGIGAGLRVIIEAGGQASPATSGAAAITDESFVPCLINAHMNVTDIRSVPSSAAADGSTAAAAASSVASWRSPLLGQQALASLVLRMSSSAYGSGPSIASTSSPSARMRTTARRLACPASATAPSRVQIVGAGTEVGPLVALRSTCGCRTTFSHRGHGSDLWRRVAFPSQCGCQLAVKQLIQDRMRAAATVW